MNQKERRAQLRDHQPNRFAVFADDSSLADVDCSSFQSNVLGKTIVENSNTVAVASIDMPVVDRVRIVDSISSIAPPPSSAELEPRTRRVMAKANRFVKKRVGQPSCADECCREGSEEHVEKPKGNRRVSFEETVKAGEIPGSKPIKSRTEPTKGEETTSYTKPAKTVIPTPSTHSTPVNETPAETPPGIVPGICCDFACDAKTPPRIVPGFCCDDTAKVDGVACPAEPARVSYDQLASFLQNG